MVTTSAPHGVKEARRDGFSLAAAINNLTVGENGSVVLVAAGDFPHTEFPTNVPPEVPVPAFLVDNGRDEVAKFVRNGIGNKGLKVSPAEGRIEAEELGGGDSARPRGMRLPRAGAAQIKVNRRESVGGHGGPLALREGPEAAAFGDNGVDLGEGHWEVPFG